MPRRPAALALGLGLAVSAGASAGGGQHEAVQISKPRNGAYGAAGHQVKTRLAVASRPAQLAYVRARDAARATLALPEARRSMQRTSANITQLERLAASYPQTPEAPRALFLAGDLYRAQYRLSRRAKDIEAALLRYARVCRDYPQASLADDAMWSRSEILMQQGRRNAAQSELELLLERYPQGDMVPRARAMAALLRSSLGRAAPKAADAAGRLSAVSFRPETARIAIQAAPPAVKTGRLTQRPGGVAALRPRRRVVLDPGHGGHDSGAVGPEGTFEKNVVLAIARQAQSFLLARNVEVILTRSDDTFISLQERTQLANRLQADAFVSVHANSAPNNEARGIETYSLDIASDRYAVRLAALENKTSEKEVTDLQLILADLSTKANNHDSVLLAQGMQQKMVQAAKGYDAHARDLGTKASLFYVLLGARMPSILVETAFVSNVQEERLLRQPAYQQRLGQAICDAVLDYLQKLSRQTPF